MTDISLQGTEGLSLWHGSRISMFTWTKLGNNRAEVILFGKGGTCPLPLIEDPNAPLPRRTILPENNWKLKVQTYLCSPHTLGLRMIWISLEAEIRITNHIKVLVNISQLNSTGWHILKPGVNISFYFLEGSIWSIILSQYKILFLKIDEHFCHALSHLRCCQRVVLTSLMHWSPEFNV